MTLILKVLGKGLQMTEESDKDIIQAGLNGAFNKIGLPSPTSIFNFL